MSRKDILDLFLKTEPGIKNLIKNLGKNGNIKNYYINPGFLEQFEFDAKKPLIIIKLKNKMIIKLDQTKEEKNV